MLARKFTRTHNILRQVLSVDGRRTAACFSDQPQPVKPEKPSIPDELKKASIYDLPTAQNYILENVKKFDWHTYLISHYFPKQVRDAYLTFNWFNIELGRIVQTTRESQLALGKLNFWSDSVEKIYKDQPIKEPVSICLHHACKANVIPSQLVMNLINAKRTEINTPDTADLAQFESVCEQSRLALFYLFLKLLRIDPTKSEPLTRVVQHVAKSIGMADQIKLVPYNLRKYKLYFPQETLTRHNVSVRNLWDRIQGKPNDDLYDAVLEVAAHAKMHLDEAKKIKEPLPEHSFRALLQAVETEYFLDSLEKVNFDIFNKGVHGTSYVSVPYKIHTAARNKTFFATAIQPSLRLFFFSC
eukprot:TRINITY_DN3639_c0_g1_i12.p1 TRINITY_DN3639_c0_g1~~TRINITY_DN3639_c0_g1_i12.p1  ORF type:complete len:357 (+),score=61.74 TRINITY_DN3639_c0_g1_i12:171-1241(+)